MSSVAQILLNTLGAALQEYCSRSRNVDRVGDPSSFTTLRMRLTGALIYGVLGHAVQNAGNSTKAKSPRADHAAILSWDIDKLGVRVPLYEDFIALPKGMQALVRSAWNELAPYLGNEVDEVGVVYEHLVAADPVLQDGNIRLIAAHEGRNRQGAFFTPNDLAAECVQTAVTYFLSERTVISPSDIGAPDDLTGSSRQVIRKVLANAIVADYSCGVGRFLLAYLRMATKLSVDVKSSRQNPEGGFRTDLACKLVGVDVDYIAIEIAKLAIVLECRNFALYRKITPNFTFGNPLIHAPGRSPFSEARSAFQAGSFYAAPLGMNLYSDVRTADIILGNPPWEKVRLEERSFFYSLDSGIASCSNKHDRKKLISRLSDDAPLLYSCFCRAQGDLEQAKALIGSHPYFANSAHGEINTYALFTELALNKVRPRGVIGLLVKTALVSTSANRRIFHKLARQQHLISIADFINTAKIFVIDSRERFCYILLGDNKRSSFYYGGPFVRARQITEMCNYWEFPFAAIDMLNPETGTLPTVWDSTELLFLLSLHERNPSFADVFPDAKFGRLVHFTNHAQHLRKSGGAEYIPVYEGKFIEQYDGRFATFDGVSAKDRHTAKARARTITDLEKKNRRIVPEARYYFKKSQWRALSANYTEAYSLMWRSLTSATNRRTCIATILPHQPTSQSIQFLQLKGRDRLAILLAIFNSTTFDYMVRRKLMGIDLTQAVIRQTPVPHPSAFSKEIVIGGVAATVGEHILARVGLLLSSDSRLAGFSEDIGSNLEIPPKSKRVLKSEIDYLIAASYQLKPDEYERVLAEFSDLDACELEPRATLKQMLVAYRVRH